MVIHHLLTMTLVSIYCMSLSLLPEHGALHGGAVVGQGQRRPALPARARRRQVSEEEVRHTLGELGLLLE